MKDEIRQQLIELNRIFYEKNAKEFSSTRNYYWEGWHKALEIVKLQSPKIKNVLDVGCGNGRFLRFLKDNLEDFTYLGIDHSSSFIADCQLRFTDENTYFMRFDLANDDFTKIANEKYDLISLIAVLHHIPGSSNRIELIQQISGLLKPRGILILTFWDFLRGDRMRNRLFPWSLSIFDKKDLEDGDHLLKWSDSSDTQRYCHYFSEEEKQSVIQNSSLRLLSRYSADMDNTYVILQNA